MSRRPSKSNHLVFLVVALLVGAAVVLIPMWLTGHLT